MGSGGIEPPRIAVVLGGGGLKGFAHIGVLRALAERGLAPTTFAGTSIGALIAAAHIGGMSLSEMTERAASLRRGDLFRLNSMGMLLERMRVASIYSDEPLRALIDAVVPAKRFEELDQRLLVNTVDIERGTQVIWGSPGLRDASIAEAVYASCALPGSFPPGRVRDRLCIDGGTIDNLPVAVAGLDADLVVAVDVGNSDLTRNVEIASQGFAAIYMRAATVMMHSLQQFPLQQWHGPPMILVRPRVAHIGWFTFGRTGELIEEGYRAAAAALEHMDEALDSDGGMFPRRLVSVTVDRDKCIRCGLCAAIAPHAMALGDDGIAYAREPQFDWSPADGGFIHACPTYAIESRRLDGALDDTDPDTPSPVAPPAAIGG